MRIVFVAAAVPGPGLRGYELRAGKQLRWLSRRHDVTLVAFDGAHPRDSVPALPGVRLLLVPPPVLATRAWACARALSTGLPLQVGLFDVSSMRNRLMQLLESERFDLMHVQLTRLAHVCERAVAARTAASSIPRVLDMVDSLSLNMHQRRRFDSGPAALAAGFEERRLRRYEMALCRRFERVLVVSPRDAEALGNPTNVIVNPGGVDLPSESLSVVRRQPRRILLGGNLGYFPNVDAAAWFARDILPLVRRFVPDAHLVVAGARPARRVRALRRLGSHIEVLGYVPSMAAEIRASAVAVAPIRAGSGQSNKVLEAMAAGTPVVATPQALAGVAAQDGQHLLVGRDAAEFADQIVRLLREPALGESLSRRALALVAERYTWDASLTQLERIYEEATSARP